MRCPVCMATDTRVLDSRVSGDGVSIRRRRECCKCHFRFSTVEDVQILDLTIVKRDGRREPYSREKLLAGVAKALEKRPITRERRAALSRSIEVAIQKRRAAEITTRELGEIVIKALKRVDEIAYIRFASVYRQFADVRDFERELASLLPRRRVRKKRKQATSSSLSKKIKTKHSTT